MMNTNKIAIFLALILAVMLGFLFTKSNNQEGIYKENPLILEEFGDLDGIDGVTIEIGESGINPGIEKPDLNRDMSNLTEKSTERLNELLSKKDLTADEWLEIGVFWKSGGDFEAAREAWEYVDMVSAKNYVAQINLGNLYTRDLVDLEKAEYWYEKALVSESKYPVTYFQMAEMYLYGFKDRNKAINIAKKGLKELPNDSSLQSLVDVLESGGSI